MKFVSHDEFKYNVGDVVQIKTKEEIHRDALFIPFGFVGTMFDFCGQIFKISKIEPFNGSERYYFENMPEEMKGWKWGEGMFYLAPNEPAEQDVLMLLE